MKTTENVQNVNSNMQNTADKSSLPKGEVNNTGVTNGIGIPETSGNKNRAATQNSKSDLRNRHFSNERPIF